jgi:hypothetical protein
MGDKAGAISTEGTHKGCPYEDGGRIVCQTKDSGSSVEE